MILDRKRWGLVAVLTIALITASAQASQDTLAITQATIQETSQVTRGPLTTLVQAANSPPQNLQARPIYETREVHDPNGTGRFYMGREIAQVMGPGGIPWLDRPQREDEERPELVMEALSLKGGELVADLGAGSGYFTFR
ncbi:MAG TPA: hypothetical protein VG488_07920, partial [Candidatus Angelobacter sp.]|nr:hypothetical protein [Candidatus Angelobacter sp.]